MTPDAIDGSWELASTGADDDFLMALLDDIEGRYCIDLDRVHMGGLSLGAWMAVTACAHADRVASIALVTVEVHLGGCGPMSVVAFRRHGRSRRPVRRGRRRRRRGRRIERRSARRLGQHAGVGARRRVLGSTGGGADRARREHWTYPGCAADLGVEFYAIEHGDHTWPGSAIALPGTTQTVDASEVALDRFAAHPLSATTATAGAATTTPPTPP